MISAPVKPLALGTAVHASSATRRRMVAAQGHEHSRDVTSTKKTTPTRRGFLARSVLICPCGCVAGRSDMYDKYFAWNMAHGMSGYEAEIAPIKERLFHHISTQKEGLGRPVDVIDIGIGTGPNLAYYAANARHISGLDPNSCMAEYAVQACEAAECDPAKLSLVEGVAEAMPFPDKAFDTAVCTLTLCSVPDPLAALSEVRRVLRPGGALVFIEHVQAFDPGLLRLQQALLDPLQRALADGCHLERNTAGLLEAQKWKSLELDRFHVPGASLISPHIAGIAVI